MRPAEAAPTLSLARVYLLVLLATVFWGGTPVAGKLALREIPPFTVGVLRYGLATLILVVLFRRQIPVPWTLGREDLRIVLSVGLLGTFLNHTLFFVALLFAPAAHGALIPPTTSAVWTLLLAARFGREHVVPAQLGGVGLCLVGVALVVRPEQLLAGAGLGTLLGDLLFLLGGFAWALYSYLSKVAMERLSAVGTLVLGMTVGTAALLPLALLERPWRALAVTGPAAWGAIVYLTLAGTVLSFLWWNVAIGRVGAAQTAVFTNLVPVFGVLLAWAVLGELLTVVQLLGGLLAVAGVLACQAPVLARRPPIARD